MCHPRSNINHWMVFMNFSSSVKIMIMFHIIAIIGYIGVHDYVGAIVNAGWIYTLYLIIKYNEPEPYEPLQ